MEMTKARAWRELNQAALRHNVKTLQEALAPGCRLMAVVKADAYGHGAIPVARYLQAQGWRPLPWPVFPKPRHCGRRESRARYSFWDIRRPSWRRSFPGIT